MQALIARGIGDFRAPDMMRFGFALLYLNVTLAPKAADEVVGVIHERRSVRLEFSFGNKVTWATRAPLQGLLTAFSYHKLDPLNDRVTRVGSKA